MGLDAATRAFLAATAGAPALHEIGAAAARAQRALLRPRYGRGPGMQRVCDVGLDAPDGGRFAVRVLAPGARAHGVVVWLHGGGWVVGALDDFDVLGRLLAARSGCTVVLVEYRLAPEHRFPAAVLDAWTALRWAASRGAKLAGRDTPPLVIGGDSAGATLATVAARRARDAGGPELALQVLVYPVTDCDLERPSYLDPDNQLILSRDTMAWCWEQYLPAPAGRTSADASPLRVADPAGLPPTLMVTAEHDVLNDEVTAYAARLRAAGVAVQERRVAGQMHGFLNLVNILPASVATLDEIAAAIADHPAVAAG